MTDLPARFAPLLAAARTGSLPGFCKLPSGIVTNLNEYALAWAEDWPGDAVHITRRLDEALNHWRQNNERRP